MAAGVPRDVIAQWREQSSAASKLKSIYWREADARLHPACSIEGGSFA
jgi:hypothetical protein